MQALKEKRLVNNEETGSWKTIHGALLCQHSTRETLFTVRLGSRNWGCCSLMRKLRLTQGNFNEICFVCKSCCRNFLGPTFATNSCLVRIIQLQNIYFQFYIWCNINIWVSGKFYFKENMFCGRIYFLKKIFL